MYLRGSPHGYDDGPHPSGRKGEEEGRENTGGHGNVTLRRGTHVAGSRGRGERLAIWRQGAQRDHREGPAGRQSTRRKALHVCRRTVQRLGHLTLAKPV